MQAPGRYTFKFSRRRRVAEFTMRVVIAAWIGVCVACFGTTTQSHAQSLLPPSHEEIADQERLSWTLKKFPPQPYMNEIYWRWPSDTPAFFRDSLMQFVARTYYLGRDNFDGSKSQAWAAGGWIAFRSGLIGDLFGVHAAYYTSQKLFGPLDEDGTKLLAPGQNSLGMLGQIYGRVQIVDQEIRGGRQLVDTPLINPQDNRMVPNTFEGATLVSLPDKDRNYDYALGYLWTVKQRDSNDFISMSNALASGDVENRGAPFFMVKYRPVPGLSTAFMDYYVQDFVNTGFVQAEYDFRQPKDVPNWIIGANVIDQRSVGSDLLTGKFLPDLSGLCEGANELCRMDFIRRGLDYRRWFKDFLAVRHKAKLHRYAASIVRQCQGKGHWRQRCVRFRLCIQQGRSFRTQCGGVVHARLGRH